MAALLISGYPWSPVSTQNQLECDPSILGAGDTTVFANTCRLVWARIGNPTSGNITVSMQDGQDSPVYVVPPTVLPPGSSLTFRSDWGGDLCLGGMVVSATGAGLNF